MLKNDVQAPEMKILIIDDIKNNRIILKNFLSKNNYKIALADNGAEGIEIAKSFMPDLILLDVMMPVMDGYEACELMRKDKDLAEIPIVFVTAKNQQEDIVKGFKAGGNDYIVKPFFFEEILLRIKVHIENKLLREELFKLSMTDPLTNIWNRRYFLERVEYEFKRSQRYGSDLSLAIVDIDDFKKVNDIYGHTVGDMVIVELVKRLEANIRDIDFLCRWGGEEFVMLLVGADIESAATLVERIRNVLNENVIDTGKDSLAVTLSYGVAAMAELEESEKNIEMLCSLADKRLYVAKNTGKDRVVFE